MVWKVVRSVHSICLFRFISSSAHARESESMSFSGYAVLELFPTDFQSELLSGPMSNDAET